MLVCMFLQAMTYAIERSCINKAEVVSEDEREGGLRATLNLGHTFGHAMESSQGYGETLLRPGPCRAIRPTRLRIDLHIAHDSDVHLLGMKR